MQTTIRDFSTRYPVETLDDCSLTSLSSTSQSRALTSSQAREWAETVVRALSPNTEFTSMSLFSRVRLLGDKRARGGVIKHLQRLGLITVKGITKDDQQGRNGGFAVLWKVV